MPPIVPPFITSWRLTIIAAKIRDSLTSGSIGRPQHFSCLDCDIELPQPGDLEVFDFAPKKNEQVEGEKAQYFCQMAKLSIICKHLRHPLCKNAPNNAWIVTDIITSRYAVRATHNLAQKIACEKSLEDFQSQIPPVLHYRGFDEQSSQGLWSAMLSIAYM